MNKKILFVNLFLSILELINFFIGIEFFSGGICEYWKCQTIFVAIWVLLVIIHLFINTYFLFINTYFLSEELI